MFFPPGFNCSSPLKRCSLCSLSAPGLIGAGRPRILDLARESPSQLWCHASLTLAKHKGEQRPTCTQTRGSECLWQYDECVPFICTHPAKYAQRTPTTLNAAPRRTIKTRTLPHHHHHPLQDVSFPLPNAKPQPDGPHIRSRPSRACQQSRLPGTSIHKPVRSTSTSL